MEVVAWMEGRKFAIEPLERHVFDDIVFAMPDVRGRPIYYKDGSNPPDVWPRPAPHVTVEVRDAD